VLVTVAIAVSPQVEYDPAACDMYVCRAACLSVCLSHVAC